MRPQAMWSEAKPYRTFLHGWQDSDVASARDHARTLSHLRICVHAHCSRMSPADVSETDDWAPFAAFQFAISSTPKEDESCKLPARCCRLRAQSVSASCSADAPARRPLPLRH